MSAFVALLPGQRVQAPKMEAPKMLRIETPRGGECNIPFLAD